MSEKEYVSKRVCEREVVYERERECVCASLRDGKCV